MVALRRCSLDEAFIDILQTAKQHSVSTLGLAGALVAIAENDTRRDVDDTVIAAANQAWGALLDDGPVRGGEREHAQLPPMTVLTSGGSPDLMGLQS
ncbi:hypothetical protein A5706_16225 [Mycobacterium sp. E796]|nr:hypothetical protein A5706_16225 [Mycobacterium sp. E796]